MLNLYKHTKTKSLCTTVVHNTATVLIIFPPNLQTFIVAHTLSKEGEGGIGF